MGCPTGWSCCAKLTPDWRQRAMPVSAPPKRRCCWRSTPMTCCRRALCGPSRRVLERDPAAGFAYGIMRFFGDWTGDIVMPGWDPYRLLYRHTIGPTALTRRALFDDIGGWDVQLAREIVMGYEDWEFWLDALARGWHGIKVSEVTHLYRRHGSTMLSGARREYRRWYRALRTRHADLYRRRPELARQTDLGPLGRAVYRFYWGPRPIPATVEHRLHTLVWGRTSR